MPQLVFHIGHHKTGTTWLQTGYFREHPDIRLLCDPFAPAEDPFLAYLVGSNDRRFDAKRAAQLLEQISARAGEPPGLVHVVSAERLSGHPYSGGYDSYRLAERMHACAPDARVVCVLRNQVDMLTSVYKELIRDGYCGTPEQLFASRHWRGTSFDRDMYAYDLLVERYRQLFSPQQVLFLIHEDLERDPAAFLERLSGFLGVAPVTPGNTATVVNRSHTSIRRIRAQRLVNQLRESEPNPFPVIRLERRGKPALYLRRLLQLFASPAPLVSDALRSEIVEHYRSSNARLRELIDGDLSRYA